MIGKRVTNYERKAKETFEAFMADFNLSIISNTETHMWCTKRSKSTIDYVLSNLDQQWKNRNL